MKPHYNAQAVRRMMAINSVMRKLPYYGNSPNAHLFGTKHSKSWQDYGYSIHLDFWFYHAMYSRTGLAHAVVTRTVDSCWLTNPTISIGEDDDARNAQEKALDDLFDRLDFWNQCRDLDEMQRVGHYSGAIMRVADGLPLSKPLDGKFSADKIDQIMPAWEGQLQVSETDTNPDSLRYGLPTMYTYHQRGVSRTNQRDGNETFQVHHSRVIIWNEGARGNTIYGRSALEPCFNALMDWEKVRGAGGEGFWRQAALRAVLQANDKTGGQMPKQEELDELSDVIAEMMQSFDQVPFLGNMDLNTMQTTLSDPKGFAEIILQDVAAGAGRSAKGLVGAQTGVLAGEEDTGQDLRTDQSRRENYLTKQIGKMLDWFVFYGVIPDADWQVHWDDLAAPSDSAKLDNVVKMSDINMKNPGTFTPEEMRTAAGYDAEPEGIEEPEFQDGPEEQDAP